MSVVAFKPRLAQQPAALESVLERCGELATASLANDALRDAFNHHLRRPGGCARARLTVEVAYRVGLPEDEAIAIAASVELLHNASLIHDDMQDRQATRRNQASVWALYGPDTALMCGDVLIAAAGAALAQLPATQHAPSLQTHLHAAVAETASGQLADRSFAANYAPSFADYLGMASLKCGPLFALPFELCLARVGEVDAAHQAGRAARHFAVAYQLADDLNDVVEDLQLGTINGVLLLQALQALSVEEARFSVMDHMRDELTTSLTLAQQLPFGAGAPLEQLALDLVEKAG